MHTVLEYFKHKRWWKSNRERGKLIVITIIVNSTKCFKY